MHYDMIGIGDRAPLEFNVIIEISANSGFVKYEFNKSAGALFVDRIMQSSMQYPCNYGFVPHTLSGDGDPMDVLLYTHHSIIPGSVVAARAIGVLVTEDENGQDEKILAIPIAKIDPALANINSYEDLPTIALDRISHFFSHYKDLEKNKWVKISGWQDAKRAHELINEAIKRHSNNICI